jgi:endothelin-converting enzyme/putative endopeptidase
MSLRAVLQLAEAFFNFICRGPYMRYLGVLLLALPLLSTSCAKTQESAEKPKAAAENPYAKLRFNAAMLDKTVDPCTDFYAYACKTWQAQNPIPGDQPAWGRFNELNERGQFVLRDIFQKYSGDDAKRSAVEQKIGDYYQSCMDESAIEKAGTAPLNDDLAAIDAMKSKQDLAPVLIRLHRRGVTGLFTLGSTQDFKDATQVIAEVDEGGMALPDRDYYLKTDAKSVELRKHYQQHIQKMFELAGDPAPQATAQAKTIVAIETALAKGALDRVSRRDPEKVYHRMSSKDLAGLTPGFGWDAYLNGIGAPATSSLNVTEPKFIQTVDSVLKTFPLEDWKTYLRWHTLHGNAQLLPARFVNETFEFFDKELTGSKELSPRWKRCVRYATGDLGEAAGQKYVELTFGSEGKARTLKMVEELDKALAADIKQLSWMGEDTKKQALEKLAAISNRIGYPDSWRDYSKLKITRGDAVGNSMRANEFEFQRQLDKIGKPVNKHDWPYPPSTVNASYNPQLNNITFPAGILQPPFYDNDIDDAMNYGGIGAVIGHEVTHGFDDQGSQFDAQGNMRDWWTPQDKKEFNSRTKCIADQYSDFPAVDDIKLNGKLTLGENVADNGGLRIAYMALLSSLAGKEPAPIDGLTAKQRFFLGWANVWCQNRSDAFARMLATVDPHSPGRWRVNGAVSNMPEFKEAFGCKADAPMVRQNACRAW